jgi:Large eukaryotic DNA virus major capsid protein/Major capsid protein N-terminus
MSTGAIFQLITNDGKQDKLLMATDKLSTRLQNIRNQRVGMAEEDPSLADIEQTHVLFVNAHFKPFAAIAYEYNKVSLSNVTLGSEIQFSIPQFGDFFNDMVLHLVLTAPTTQADFPAGTPDLSDVPLYRWCDYPGERILSKVSVDVNGNPLDDYTDDTYVMHRQFRVGADKIVGWNRNMGHEMPNRAFFQYQQDSTVTSAPLAARASFDHFSGHQTYKKVHDDLTLLIPLLFWFNSDPSMSIPSVAIPYGQRYIKCQLATKEKLLRAIVNPSATLALTNPRVTSPVISVCDLYINNLFVQPDIHDIYIKRIGFTLVRVHRRQITNVNKGADLIHLQQLKWPIETIFLGIRPTANITANTTVTARNSQGSVVDPLMEDWHRFEAISNSIPDAGSVNGVGTLFHLKTRRAHVKNLSIETHGIPLYNNLPAQFFNSYVPSTYGGWNINTPTDKGLYMINFCLYPGSYQPSGHVNASRAREFYFRYTSDYIASDVTGDLIINAVAINFLLISDGSAIMRYTT